MARVFALAPTTLAAAACWVLTLALGAVGLVLYAAQPYWFDTYNNPLEWLPTPLLNVILAIAFATVGAAVASRQPRNATGWLFLAAGMLLSFTVAAQFYAAYAIFVSPGSLPAGRAVAWLFKWSSVPTLGVIGILLPQLFPNGRPVSTRWRPVLRISVGVLVLTTAASAFGLEPVILNWSLKYLVANPFPLGVPPALGGSGTMWHQLERVAAFPMIALIVIATSSLVARARSAGALERQQIKWVALAAIFPGTGMVTAVLLGFWDVGMLLAVIGMFAIPIAAGLAMLRYRLYEIDVLINRAVVYAVLSATLGLVYVAGVIGAQALLGAFTGGNEIAVAATTLLVVALFHPVRRRIQDAVDRRFYRARYQAQWTIDAFGARLRDEVDLAAIEQAMLAAVDRTLNPARMSIWLRRR